VTDETTLHVPSRFRRGARQDEEASIDSAVWLIEHMCRCVGFDDLGDSEVLDVGCGVKFTQAFIGRSLPIRRYVGVDVYEEMIEFLRRTVDDPRFEYHHVNTHNELYNPNGEPLTEATVLPVGEFDLICLFSVFTHLAPSDYRTMLGLLRRHVKRDGRLFFTLFIDEPTQSGHGRMDRFAKALSGMSPEEIAERIEQSPNAPGAGATETFKDLDPARPLMWAVYSERYARELIEGTGWEVVSLSPPDEYIQHHFVCAPA